MSYLPSATHGRQYSGHFDDGTPKRLRPNLQNGNGYKQYGADYGGSTSAFLPAIDQRSGNSDERRPAFTSRRSTGKPLDGSKPVRDFFKLVNQEAVDYEQHEQVVKKYYAYAYSRKELGKVDGALRKRFRQRSTVPKLQQERLQEQTVKQIYHD